MICPNFFFKTVRYISITANCLQVPILITITLFLLIIQSLLMKNIFQHHIKFIFCSFFPHFFFFFLSFSLAYVTIFFYFSFSEFKVILLTALSFPEQMKAQVRRSFLLVTKSGITAFQSSLNTTRSIHSVTKRKASA